MNAYSTIHAGVAMLALTVDRKALADALGAMKTTGAPIIEKRNTIPILSCVLLDATPDKLTVYGTDLDVLLAVELPAATDGLGRVAVDFDALQKAVKAAKGESVRIVDMGGARSPRTGVATLSHDSGTARLPTFDADDFPMLKQADGIQLVEFDPETLRLDLDRVAPCISTEETRYYLNGVFFHTPTDEYGRKRLRMAATDGHRLGRVDRDVPADMPEDAPDAIVPRKAATFMRKRLKGAKTCYFGWGRSQAVFQAGRMRLVTKLIDGTFPDYSRVIPSGSYSSDYVIGGNADELAAAAEQVTAHCTGKTRSFSLSAGEGWATAFATDPDNGCAGAVIEGTTFQPDASKGATDFVVGFNARYFADIMASYPGHAVTLRMADASAPCRIDCEATPEFVTVLMPMRGDGTVRSPETLRKMNRDALEVFAEDMSGKLGPHATVAAKRAAGAIVTAAIDLLAARTGQPRYEARAVILRDLADMKGEAHPLMARAAAAKLKAGQLPAIRLVPPVQAEEPEDYRSCHWHAGFAAKTRGEARELPSYFIGESVNSRAWLQGWDEGTVEPVAQSPQAEPVPYQADEPIETMPDAPAQADEPKRGTVSPGPIYKGEPWADVLRQVALNSVCCFDDVDGRISIIADEREGNYRTAIPLAWQDEARALYERQGTGAERWKGFDPDAVEAETVEEPETVDAHVERVRASQPMFATLQAFKAAAGQGTRWALENFDGTQWGGYRVRTVATVRARDIGFIGENATIEDCRKADVRGFGGRSWVGFPKQGNWTSDPEGLVILYASGQPCMRLRPVPVETGKQDDSASVETVEAPADELAALRSLVVDLSARVAAMEAAGKAVQPVSDAPAPSAPVETAESAPRRSQAHERAIRMAWLQRQRVRGIKRDRARSEAHAAAMVERAIAAEAARDETIESTSRTVWRYAQRIARLTAVLTGRKRQIAALGRDLLIARNRTAEMRAEGTAPPALATVAKPAPAAPARVHAFDDGDRYAAAV